MLNQQEWQQLMERVKAGDERAKEKVLTENFNLVRSIVHRFMNRGYEWDDLFQIGCIGLIKAVERFDLSYDVKFSTYAVPMIIGEIRRFMRDDNPVKVSRPVKELAYKIYKTQESLQSRFGREPTLMEVAQELSLTSEEVVAALEATQPVTSLYEQAYRSDKDSVLIIDQVKHTESPENRLLEELNLQDFLGRLNEREQKIIELRFFQDKTQTEIAQLMGISQVQVSRLEKQALKNIRKMMQTS